MVYCILFLVIGVIIDMHAMEQRGFNPLKKSGKNLDVSEQKTSKPKYLNIANRTQSISPKGSPRELSSSTEELKTSRKNSKSGKQSSDPSERSLNLVEQELLSAVLENKTYTVMSILYPNVNMVHPSGKTLLIITIQNENEDLVKEFLAHKDINVNKADGYGNTPLHHAVLRCNKIIIDLLLFDYRVNSFIKNNKGNYAHQLIHVDVTDDDANLGNLSLKWILFARSTLDKLVNDEVFGFQIDKQSNDVNAMNGAISRIKERIEQDHMDQKDYQKLPEATKLSSYATDEFIRDMILYRLKCKEVHTDSHVNVNSSKIYTAI